MLSTDFRLPRAQGHAINALLSLLLWIGLVDMTSCATQAASRLLGG
jgi:hypothetical protein